MIRRLLDWLAWHMTPPAERARAEGLERRRQKAEELRRVLEEQQRERRA